MHFLKGQFLTWYISSVFGQNWWFLSKIHPYLIFLNKKRVLGDKKGVSNVLTTVYSREGKLFVSIKYRGHDIKYLRIEKFFKIEFFQHSEQDWNWCPPNVFGSQLCLHSSCKQYWLQPIPLVSNTACNQYWLLQNRMQSIQCNSSNASITLCLQQNCNQLQPISNATKINLTIFHGANQ